MENSISDNDLLFWDEEELRKSIEAMFFAYRSLTVEADRILSQRGYGRAHHRAIHFINRCSGTTVNNLLLLLGITKQSLNRVLRTLIEDGLVLSKVGETDRRERNLFLTRAGKELEAELSSTQRAVMKAAFQSSGVASYRGFCLVLDQIMDDKTREIFRSIQGLSLERFR